MNKFFAEELDLILKGGIENGGYFTFKSERFTPNELGSQLEKDGYGEWLGGNDFLIIRAGYAFYNGNDGYMKRFGKEEENEKLLQLQIENLEYKKRIRFWKIVSAILATVSTILGIINLVLLFKR
jgi:hypothetical protein